MSIRKNCEEGLENSNCEMKMEDSGFDIRPCEAAFDLSDKQRFIKLSVTAQQRKHLSALAGEIPNVMAAGTIAQAYYVSFPEGIPHTLTALRQGGYGSMVRGSEGKFVGSASFRSMTAQAVAMGAFTAMSIASSQYFLAQINNELSMMSLKIDKVLEFLYGDKKAELISELTFTKYAYENFNSIMTHKEQRIATMVSIQEAKKIAMKDVEFYMGDLYSVVAADKKEYPELGTLIDKVFQVRDSLELSEQLYVMSSLLEMYYAQNHDESYAAFLESTMTAYIDKCEKRILSCFSILNGRFNEFKGNLVKKIDTSVYEKRVLSQIEILNSGEESAMKKVIRTALRESTEKAEFILRNDGSLFFCKSNQG